MKRRLVVHVGTAKAGSTSIQTMLARRSGALRACGIEVLGSRSGGNARGTGHWPPRAVMRSSSGAAHARLERIAWARLEGWIRRSDAESFVLSSEMFTTWRVRERCAELLLELARGENLEIDIVGYVRPQWQRLESGYAQRVKTGNVGLSFERFVAPRLGSSARDERLDYNRVFGALRAAFGAAHVKVLPLEGSRLPQGLLAHFLETVGAGGGRIDVTGLPRTNLRLGAKEVEVRRAVRARIGDRFLDGEQVANRLAWLSALFDDDAPFAGFGLDEVRAIEDRFADSNARFARDYGIDAAGVLFRDPVGETAARPNAARWEDLGPAEQGRVRRYVLDRTGVDLGSGAPAPAARARVRVRARIVGRWLAATARLPAQWPEYAAFPNRPTRRYWKKLWRQGWRR